MTETVLIVPAFVAGLLTFLAPCTLPLVPAYLAFISGVPADDLQDKIAAQRVRMKVFGNGALFVLGFSTVFIALGVTAGLLGIVFAPYQVWLSRIGGAVVLAFGLFMLGALKVPFLNREFKVRGSSAGGPLKSFILGASFSLGWTPCVGPILGSILILAGASGTALQGALLLAVFSLGLAVPFLALAYGIGSAERYVARLTPLLNTITLVGGLFLVGLGILLMTDRMSLFITQSYRLLQFLHYDALIKYL